jgi:DNA-directed RNA polymerase specialized sigma24 family protein
MRDLTLSEIARLRAEDRTDAVPLEMDEDTFRGFYDRTARALRVYLGRVTGDPALADDLLQESCTVSCGRVARTRAKRTGGTRSSGSPRTWCTTPAAAHGTCRLSRRST